MAPTRTRRGHPAQKFPKNWIPGRKRKRRKDRWPLRMNAQRPRRRQREEAIHEFED